MNWPSEPPAGGQRANAHDKKKQKNPHTTQHNTVENGAVVAKRTYTDEGTLMQHTSEGLKNTHNPLQLKVTSHQHPFMDNVYWCNWSLEKYRITASIKRKTAFEGLVIDETPPPQSGPVSLSRQLGAVTAPGVIGALKSCCICFYSNVRSRVMRVSGST